MTTVSPDAAAIRRDSAIVTPDGPDRLLPARRALPFLPTIGAVMLLPKLGLAHEAWLLTPGQIAASNAAPKPDLFTEITAANAGMLAAAIAVALGLGFAMRSSKRLAGIPGKLTACARHSRLVIRVCLALTLAMAALGLHPRHGTALFEAATLGFPDLELRLLGPGWTWLAPVQLGIALALLLGRPIRLAALATLALTTLSFFLFGSAALPYAGALASAALYLLLSEHPARAAAGETPGHDRATLARVRWDQALFLTRLLTGGTFVYCGIVYKFLQPNLALHLVVEGHLPTFGLSPETFVFGMALVETLAGALMMTGILLQPIVIALFAAFLFLGTALGESPLGHVLFYGNLFALATGGAGRWHRAVPAAQAPRPEPTRGKLQLARAARQP